MLPSMPASVLASCIRFLPLPLFVALPDPLRLMITFTLPPPVHASQAERLSLYTFREAEKDGSSGARQQRLPQGRHASERASEGETVSHSSGISLSLPCNCGVFFSEFEWKNEERRHRERENGIECARVRRPWNPVAAFLSSGCQSGAYERDADGITLAPCLPLLSSILLLHA